MQNLNDAIKENLIDAGCDEQFITLFMILHSEHKTNEMLSLLAEQRKNLLDGVHLGERKIYCLDYLANKIKNFNNVD